MAKKKIFTIFIAEDSNEENAKKEQYRYFQRDGETVQVPIGRFVDVPEWVAIRAKDIGYVKTYQVREA